MAIALVIMVIMVTWWDGWKRLAVKVMTMTIPKEKFVDKIAAENPVRIPGTGVFLSTFYKEVPPMLLHYANQTGAVHDEVVILSVLTDDVPAVEPSRWLETDGLGHGVYRVIAHYGFMETPDVPHILVQARSRGVKINLDNITYYMGRISLVPARKRTLPKWRRFLFTFMLRNAVSGATYLNIPPANVIEIGVQMEF